MNHDDDDYSLHLCTFKTPILEDIKYVKDNCEFHALTYLSSRRSIAVNYNWLDFFLRRR